LVPTKAVNKAEMGRRIKDNGGRDPEDISHPAGPKREFCSVAEMEKELRNMKVDDVM